MYRSHKLSDEDIKLREIEYAQAETERIDRNKKKAPSQGSLDLEINQAEALIKKGDPKGQKMLETAMLRKKSYYVGGTLPRNAK